MQRDWRGAAGAPWVVPGAGRAGSVGRSGSGRRAAARAGRRRPDILRVVLFALLMMTIGRVHQYFGFLEPLRPALLTTVIGLAVVVFKPHLVSFAVLKRSWQARVVIALVVWACIGAPFGLSLGGSASFILSDYSKVLALWLLLTLAIRSTRDLRFLIWAYLAGAGFLCYLSVFVYGVSSVGSLTMRLSGNLFMYDPNDICVLLLIALPLTLLVFQATRGIQRWTALAIAVLSGAAVALSGSRGGFVGLGAVVLALLVFANSISIQKRVGFAVSLALALVFAAPEGYWDQMKTILEPKSDYNWDSEDGRLEIWKRGLGYMLRNPITGVGIDNFGRAEGTISEKARYHVPGTGLKFNAPHNSTVQVGAELGLPGLFFWLALTVGNIIALVRLRRRIPARWANGSPDEQYLHGLTLYLPIAIFGFIVTSSFVSFAYLDPIYILVAFSSGLCVLAEHRMAIERRGRRRGARRVVVGGVGK